MLAECITKTNWLNDELQFSCSDSTDAFMDLINSNTIRLATINLSIDEEIDNLHVCEQPSDGLGGIKSL